MIKWQDERFREQLLEKMLQELDEISRRLSTLIIVSNEVLYEPIGSNELILVYNRLLGKLHQAIVKQSNGNFLVEYGIPQC